MSEAALKVEMLTKRFGALIANDAINLEVLPGELHAVIGPNGSGKTTLLSQLSGELAPDDGTITFFGQDVTDTPVHERALMGLARSYQITSVIQSFTALDNVALAAQAKDGHSYKFWRPARSVRHLNEKSAALGRLAAGMAHEINNPASAVRSDIDTLKLYADKLPESKIRAKMLKIIDRDVKAISRVTDIVSAVKSVHRPDEWHLVNLHDEIELQLTLLNKEYKNRIKIIREYGDLSDISVHGSDIGQVFLNLLQNAIDAIEGEGEITIKSREEDKYVFIDINDTGTGIPEEILPKLNQSFFTTREVGKGTGLGLYASHLTAERHGGKLYVSENEIGAGATFTLQLFREGYREAYE